MCQIFIYGQTVELLTKYEYKRELWNDNQMKTFIENVVLVTILGITLFPLKLAYGEEATTVNFTKLFQQK